MPLCKACDNSIGVTEFNDVTNYTVTLHTVFQWLYASFDTLLLLCTFGVGISI